MSSLNVNAVLEIAGLVAKFVADRRAANGTPFEAPLSDEEREVVRQRLHVRTGAVRETVSDNEERSEEAIRRLEDDDGA